MNRRSFLISGGVLSLWPARFAVPVRAQPAPKGSLLDAPLELAGAWPSSPPAAVRLVLTRVRQVCLSGLRLLSDRQPAKLRVDGHTEGLPAVWLHDEPVDTAWVIVDIGPADWSKLAYQFGHELGHVLCNSWQRSATPRPPSQWIEEAVVESFSVRSLGLLAASWQTNPPFAGDHAFGTSLFQYRGNLIEQYRAAIKGFPNAAAWFRANRKAIDGRGGMIEGSPVIGIVPLLEQDPACVEDMGAANRWLARTGIPIELYLAEWQKSCAEIGTSGRLPAQLRTLFGLV
jgi:hypothetical protein